MRAPECTATLTWLLTAALKETESTTADVSIVLDRCDPEYRREQLRRERDEQARRNGGALQDPPDRARDKFDHDGLCLIAALQTCSDVEVPFHCADNLHRS
jgi:hypothetical protein